MFGSLEDFLLTSMASQLDSLQFINEGSTKRKEILAKFLDLHIFDKKFKMAKDDASDLKGALKRLEGKEFEQEIKEAEHEIKENENTTKQKEEECEKIRRDIFSLQEKVAYLTGKIDSIPAEIIDVKNINKSLINFKDSHNDLVLLQGTRGRKTVK